ncbi:MAG: phosphopantetheine-binding protein [Gammaproteobacteria bacterium]|nr:phosphopantetheine-binding protein [Gammaproteobacteria bacterium]
MEKNEIKTKIREKLTELAGELGNDASQISDDDIIPATGLVDSIRILGLVVWYEKAFGMSLKQEEINIDNLGSIELMADYVLKRKSG